MSRPTDRPLLSLGITAIGLTAIPASAGDVLWDNGSPDGTGGHSNATEGVFGARRTVLDDFVVPDGETWRITDFLHNHIWNALPPGSGTGMELLVWEDDDCTPVRRLLTLEVVGYREEATGRTFFARPEVMAYTELEPLDLGPGHYWIEGTVVGPENNFWLTLGDVIGCEHWVNYDDLGGLQRGTDIFGVASAINFRILGTLACPADLDESGTVDFEDLLALLTEWGVCVNQQGCPEDLDGDRVVGVSDLVILLAAWGPCPGG